MNTQQRRPLAVVTGASSGIGFELADLEDTPLGEGPKDDPADVAKAEMHRKMAQPPAPAERRSR